MSSIRIKNKPGKSQSDNRTTIDVIHVNVINTITKNNKDLNNLKSKLEIENNKNNKNLKKIYELTFKINEIKKKI